MTIYVSSSSSDSSKTETGSGENISSQCISNKRPWAFIQAAYRLDAPGRLIERGRLFQPVVPKGGVYSRGGVYLSRGRLFERIR